MINLDYQIFYFLNGFSGKYFLLDKLIVFFAKYFEFFLLLLLLIFFRKTFKILIECFIAGILSRFLLVEFIRANWPRLRPFVDNNVNLLINYNPLEPSFPSGHASFYFALSAIVYLYDKRMGAIFYIFSFIISLARVMAGIHWPFDILAGIILGVFSGYLVHFIFFRYFSKKL
jgi:undecaprenyl-diphosphatase